MSDPPDEWLAAADRVEIWGSPQERGAHLLYEWYGDLAGINSEQDAWKQLLIDVQQYRNRTGAVHRQPTAFDTDEIADVLAAFLAALHDEADLELETVFRVAIERGLVDAEELKKAARSASD